MPMISINVQNNSTTSKDFLYFMGPVNSSDAGQIYVTSLGTANLGAYVQCGTIITFQLDFQYQAGVQQAHSLPIAGQQSGFYSASQPISLSTSTGSSPDTTTMTVNPFGLTAPVAGPSVPAGTFRISTPAYDSNVYKHPPPRMLSTPHRPRPKRQPSWT